jgi:hypothetical protein
MKYLNDRTVLELFVLATAALAALRTYGVIICPWWIVSTPMIFLLAFLVLSGVCLLGAYGAVHLMDRYVNK